MRGLVVFISLLLCKAAFAQNFSLMFTKEEIAAIEGTDQETLENAPQSPALYLGGLFFIDDQRWSLWLNDQQITREKPSPSIKVISINREGAKVAWHHEGEVHQTTLKPNQTYLAQDRLVVDGDQR